MARRDERELANKAVYDACMFLLDMFLLVLTDSDTKLADHAAIIATSGPPVASAIPQEETTSSTRTLRPGTPGTNASPAPSSDLITTLRTDLAAAQSTRVTLTAELGTLNNTLASLQSTLTATSTTANSLAREKAILERKLRDRDEELREKSRLLERVQDEVVALEMQLNLLEQERSTRQEKTG